MYGFFSFYSILFFILAFFCFIINPNQIKHKNNNLYVFICVILLIIAGFRGETVGGDLKRYIPEFYGVASLSDLLMIITSGSHEPGYRLFIKFLSWISSSERCFLIGTSLVSLMGPFFLFYKYSKNSNVSLLLYFAMGFYTNTFNNVRQTMAMSVAFGSLYFLMNKQFLKYLIGILVATSFHYSAIVMLFFYPFTLKPVNFKKLLFYTIAGLSLAIASGFSIFKYVVELFFMKYDPESIMEDSTGAGYGLFVFYSILFLLITIFYFKKKKVINSEQQNMLSMFVIFQMFAMIIQLTSPIFHSMVRMTYYFFIPIITLAVPYIYSLIKNRSLKIMFYTIVFSYAIAYMGLRIYAFNQTVYSNGQGVIPYVLGETTIF